MGTFGIHRRAKAQLVVMFQQIDVDLCIGRLCAEGHLGSGQEVLTFVRLSALKDTYLKWVLKEYGEAALDFVHVDSS